MGGPGSRYHLSGKMEKPTQSFSGEGQLLRFGRPDRSTSPSWERRGYEKSALGSAVVAAARSRCGGDGCGLLSFLRDRSPSSCLSAYSPRWRVKLPDLPPRFFSPPPGGDGGSPG